jgi:hypothetical protein
MQRGIVTLGSTLGIGLAALTGGCTASGGDASIIVLRNVLPQTGCVLTAMTSEVGVAQGALDAQFQRGYVFSAQLKSRITATTASADQRTIFIEGANVDIAFPGSTLFSADDLASLKASGLTHFKSEFSTIIAPSGLSDVGFELIPAELVVMAANKPGFTSVVADTSFTVLGELAGGEVTSQIYHYPVTILGAGLLHVTGNCSDLASSFTPRIGNPCNPGQDGIVDCCRDPAGRNVCPAVGTKM